MKKLITLTGLVCSFSLNTVSAGEALELNKANSTGLDSLKSPISNPTLFDSVLPSTQLHAMFLKQAIPTRLNLANGTSAPAGGDINIFAVQLELALNQTTSLVASKDGYIDFNPDNTLSKANGFANIALGVKHAFYINPVKQEALSASIVAEVPTGNRDVFQGNGDGAINLTLNGAKLINQWQLQASTGVHLPFDQKEESTTGFLSAHIGYNLTDKFYVLAEANWFRLLSEGNGRANFQPQVGGAVPAVASFEGGDLINLGAANASINKDIVTAALGFRFKTCGNSSLGAAYEMPLTDDSNNLMKSRITLDFIYKF